jgi:hypothetical protein
MATLNLTFDYPGTPPAAGFTVFWRVVGGPWQPSVTVFSSPVTINVPNGVDIEGEIVTNCKQEFGQDSPPAPFYAANTITQCKTYYVTTSQAYPVHINFQQCGGQWDSFTVQNAAPVEICGLEGSFSSLSFDFDLTEMYPTCNN